MFGLKMIFNPSRIARPISRVVFRGGLKQAERNLCTSQSLPLEGIRVLDLTRILAGPFCTMLLSDLGAEVIKVEKIGTGDDTRLWGPPFVNSVSTYFLSVNRNKKSVAVDFKREDGREIIKQLAAKCDVMVENLVPGALDRQGLGYNDLKSTNPGLIYCSINGFGSTGPYANRAGYDVIASGIGGLMHITGSEGGEPVKTGVALTDLSTGLYAHGAILAALLQRQQTGHGQWVQCNLLSSQVSLLTHIASNYLNAGVEATRIGSAHASIVPYQAFHTSDGWLIVGAGNDRLFSILCERIGCSELSSDQRFNCNQQRVSNRDLLVKLLSDRFESKSTSEWLDILEGSGIAYGPINDLPTVFSDKQVCHMESVQTVEHSTAGEVKLLSPAVKYSGFDPRTMEPPPDLGQHTNTVLQDLLNYDTDRVKQLNESGCVFNP